MAGGSETAVLLFAADYADESPNAEAALERARRYFDLDADPTWANGRHEGDCTKTPMTCSRCVVESYERLAALVADDFIADLVSTDKSDRSQPHG